LTQNAKLKLLDFFLSLRPSPYPSPKGARRAAPPAPGGGGRGLGRRRTESHPPEKMSNGNYRKPEKCDGGHRAPAGGGRGAAEAGRRRPSKGTAGTASVQAGRPSQLAPRPLSMRACRRATAAGVTPGTLDA
jgi:hypothetical protein